MSNRLAVELDRIVRMAELREITGLPPASIYRLIKRGEFPAPYELGPNSRGWKLSDLVAWQSRLKQVALAPAVTTTPEVQATAGDGSRKGRSTDGQR